MTKKVSVIKFMICNLKSSFLSILLIFFLLTCTNCQTKNIQASQDEVLRNYLYSNFNYKIDDNIKGIVVISENICLNCNKEFSNRMKEEINNKNLIFIISSSGGLFDISEYIEKEKQANIFFDEKDEISKTKLLEGSGYISLQNKKIATIIKLDAKSLYFQLNLIKSKL